MFEEGSQYDDQMAYRNDNDDVDDDDDDDERTEYTSRLENRERDHYVRQEMYDREDGLEQYQDEEMDDDQSEPSGQYREKSGHDELEGLREHGASSRSDMSNIGMAEVENGTYIGRDESASRSRRSMSNMELADAESGMYVDRDEGGNRSRRSLSNMEMTDAESRMYVGRDESASRSRRSVSNMEMTDAESGMYVNKDESVSRSYRSLSRSRDDLAASMSDISRRRQSSFSAVSPEVDTMTRHLSTSVDLERSMRARDQERMGRYSEGHKSRFGSPSRSEKDLRLSDGLLHGKGSPFDMQRLNSSYEHQNRENQSRSASRSVGNRSSRDLNISSRSRHSSGESFSSSRNPHASSRSFDGDDMYQSPRSLLSGRRSPSIASTPRVQEDWESGSERGDGNSPLKAVTPSPVVSPRGASPASSSHRSQGSARMSWVSDGIPDEIRDFTKSKVNSCTSKVIAKASRVTKCISEVNIKLRWTLFLIRQCCFPPPPIASTQNIGALSRLSPQPSTSRQSRITDFVQQPKEEGCAKTSSEVSLPDTNDNSEETFQPFCRHASETYWDNLCADLEAYARHAGRKRIQMADFELLFKRQGYVTEKTSLNSLIRRYLPWEEADKLIPVIGADNKIYPKL
ncbi:CENPT-like protein [Mya arenaria]|uniref:CENPT-like protein n=1 Tax=Mya arenaria TaxID=6604 RepID=A0ABY7ETR7_MYAAR|nr:CENPT-like protein [Mya arenaria]